MRVPLLALAVTSALSALAIASCGEGGTGVGTAPTNAPPCPGFESGASAVPPRAGDPCNHLQVCSYPPCSGVTCPSTQTIAYCPGPGGQWQIEVRGDGGVFTDAEVPEISVDGGSDGGDAGDAGDAIDAIDATDAD